MSLPIFEGFPKIPRYNRDIVITEKIDGTNAQILIPDEVGSSYVTNTGQVLPFLCGSRTRWILPENDNHGFAKWAYSHVEELLRLGPGHHFGEWWGLGINRNYGLAEKRFSLFNIGRWRGKEDQLPGCVSLVPILYEGPHEQEAMDKVVASLWVDGSKAAPGFMKPEGIVIYHTAARQLFKITLENDAKPKGASDA